MSTNARLADGDVLAHRNPVIVQIFEQHLHFQRQCLALAQVGQRTTQGWITVRHSEAELGQQAAQTVADRQTFGLVPSRARCHNKRVCCSTDLIGTKRILPWRAGVAIASASLRSFLVLRRLRNGVTSCAVMMRGARPYSRHRRAQWCAPLQASMATTVRAGSCASQILNALRRRSRPATPALRH